MDYRRVWHPGGTYFFTVNLHRRKGNSLITDHIEELRQVVRSVKERFPFTIHGWLVLPEHMHVLMELPQGDSNFATRWRLIKSDFSKLNPKDEYRSDVRQRRGERGIWQRRYWEHLVRDEADFRAHIDYIHFNPVKHGHVGKVSDWPFSTFHRLVKQGVYPSDWVGGKEDELEYDD